MEINLNLDNRRDAKNVIVLDPETMEITSYPYVGARTMSNSVFHGRHLVLAEVGADVVEESLEEWLVDHTDLIRAIADCYQGTERRGDGTDVGTWDREAHDELPDIGDAIRAAIDDGTIERWLSAMEFLSGVWADLKDEVGMSDDLDELADQIIKEAAVNGGRLAKDQVKLQLSEAWLEIVEEEREILEGLPCSWLGDDGETYAGAPYRPFRPVELYYHANPGGPVGEYYSRGTFTTPQALADKLNSIDEGGDFYIAAPVGYFRG